MGNSTRSTGTSKRVEDQITRIGSDMNNPLKQSLRLRRSKRFNLREQFTKMIPLCLLICSDLIGSPPSSRCHAFTNLAQVALNDWQAIAINTKVRTALCPCIF